LEKAEQPKLTKPSASIGVCITMQCERKASFDV